MCTKEMTDCDGVKVNTDCCSTYVKNCHDFFNRNILYLMFYLTINIFIKKKYIIYILNILLNNN